MRRVGVVLALFITVACVRREPPPTDEASEPSTTVTTTTSSTSTPTTAPPAPRCPAPLELPREPVPAAVRAAIDARANDQRFEGNEVSISIWVDGWGEVATRDPDLRLLPASNQKLLTAMGALELLGDNARFVTSIRATAVPSNGIVAGDLVLIGGGDPTLRRTGGHSLAALARQVRAIGVTSVRGDLLIDESRYDTRRDADGWLDWQRPAFVGSLSAVIADGNRYRSDAEFLADPALSAGEELRRHLSANGVSVTGPTEHGSAAGRGVDIASLASEPVAILVAQMLMRSDNMIAESLVKEVEAVEGRPGTTAGGLREIREALSARCLPVQGTDADGSGLSRQNGRSAREWRRLLAAALATPWGAALVESLPLAGQSGTLAGRLTSPTTAGNVRAKTGSIIPGRALSGYFTTAGGRAAVFSVVVNGRNAARAQISIDSLVAAVAASDG